MLNLLTFLILLLPLMPLAFMFVPGSDVWRRSKLLLLAFILFIEMLWYLLLNWVVSAAPDLFSGVGASLLNRFYNGVWLPVAYALAIAIVGYLADRYTASKVSCDEKLTETDGIRAGDMKFLRGGSGLFDLSSIEEQNQRDKIKS
jgi:hypothetical protein